jgi:hypothetical protein
VKATAAFLALAALALQAAVSAQTLQLQPLAGFGTNGDGSLRPGDRPYLTADGNSSQRGMAYNPVTGHVLIVNRPPLGGQTINIIDGTTGTDLGQLDTSGLLSEADNSYYITPTRIPTDMYYKPPSIGGSPTWYTYGNPGYDKTDGRGDWTYIVWSCVQNGSGAVYPDNVRHGGGLVRALGKRDTLFRRCDVSPIIGVSYGAADVQNGVVTSIYGGTQAEANASWIYGWLVYSYQRTGQPLVPCVRRYSSNTVAAAASPAMPHQSPMQRMAQNLLTSELSLPPAKAAGKRAEWRERFSRAGDPMVRMEVVTEMSRLDDALTIHTMLDMLRQEQDSGVRQQLILILGFMRATGTELKAVREALLAAHQRAPGFDERARMIEVLSNIASPESAAFATAVFAASEGSPEERICAAQALFKLATRVAVEPEALRHVTQWLREKAKSGPTEQLRLGAARALAAPGQDNRDFLAELLNTEPSAGVRSFLALASQWFPSR